MKRTGISRRKFLGAATAAASISIMPAELRGAAKLAAAGENPSTIRVSSSITPIMFDPDQALGSSNGHPLARCHRKDLHRAHGEAVPLCWLGSHHLSPKH